MPLRDAGLSILLPTLEPPPLGEVIGEPPAHVVACVLVLFPRIPEAQDDLHRRVVGVKRRRLRPGWAEPSCECGEQGANYFASSSSFGLRMSSGSATASAPSAGVSSATARGATTAHTVASSSVSTSS